MNQTEYGVVPFVLAPALVAVLAAAGARYANTYLYAKYLNTRYNFHSFSPEDAAGQIALAVAEKPLDKIFMTTKARLAPEGTVQAYVKAAYILALSSRYLKNPDLAAKAADQLEKARKERNSSNRGRIESILYQAGKTIQSAAGERAYTDRQIQVVLFTLGVRVRGKKRNVQADIKQSQSGVHRLDPRKEAEQSIKDLVDAPGKLFRSGRDKYDLQRARAKRNLYIGLSVAVGLPLLAFAFWPRKGK